MIGTIVYIQKTIHLALNLYIQKKCTLRYILYKKILKICVTFLYSKKSTLRYVFICTFYRIVLISSNKRTYNQSHQIEDLIRDVY